MKKLLLGRQLTNTAQPGARIVLKACGFGQKSATFLNKHNPWANIGPTPNVLAAGLLLCLVTACAWAQTSPEPTMADKSAESQMADGKPKGDSDNSAQVDPESGRATEPTIRIGLIPDKTSESLVEKLQNIDPLSQSVWLAADDQKYLALHKPALKPQAIGAVLLLPDKNQHPNWPTTLQPLRNGLAEKGWHTWALSLPYNPQPIPTPRPVEVPSSNEDSNQNPESEEVSEKEMADESMATEDSTKQESTDAPEENAATEASMMNEQMKDDDKTQAPSMNDPDMQAEAMTPKPISQTIDQLTDSLLERVGQIANGKLLIVGIGDGAYWASRLANQLANQRDLQTYLVMIDARNQVRGNQDLLTEFLTSPMPVLDLLSPGDSAQARQQAKLRRSASRMTGYNQYYQQNLPQAAVDETQQRLTNRIHGFARR